MPYSGLSKMDKACFCNSDMRAEMKQVQGEWREERMN